MRWRCNVHHGSKQVNLNHLLVCFLLFLFLVRLFMTFWSIFFRFRQHFRLQPSSKLSFVASECFLASWDLYWWHMSRLGEGGKAVKIGNWNKEIEIRYKNRISVPYVTLPKCKADFSWLQSYSPFFLLSLAFFIFPFFFFLFFS